jgi:putative DNA primase/helicase
LVAVAGKLATEWSITDWNSDACIEAVFTCFESWVNNHREGVTSSHEEEKILEQVRHFFESQLHRFDPFIVKSPPKVNRAGFIDESQNKAKSGDYYVFVSTFKNEICKGHEPAVVERLLLKRGLLKCNAAGKVGQPIWVPSQGRTMRLYNISSLIMGEKIENR